MSRYATVSRTWVRTAAVVVGAGFLLIGVLGFIPGITAHYDTMKFAGHDSEALLIGAFQVSILHNVVHILFGVAGVVMSRTASEARLFLVGGGLLYSALWLYGLVIDHDSEANFVPVNTADNWLHLGIAVVMVGLGLLAPAGAAMKRTSARDLGR
jgi:arginine exporter protein ArgO